MRVRYGGSFRGADWLRLTMRRAQPQGLRCLDLHSLGLGSFQSHLYLASISGACIWNHARSGCGRG